MSDDDDDMIVYSFPLIAKDRDRDREREKRKNNSNWIIKSHLQIDAARKMRTKEERERKEDYCICSNELV